MRFVLVSITVLTFAFALAESLLAACPYCGVAPPSLTEQVDSYDAVVLGKFLGGDKPNRKKEEAGSTRFEIVECVKGEFDGIAQGKSLTLNRYRHSKKGDLVLLMGNKADEAIKWTEFIDMTQESFDYMANAPELDVPTQQRLVYFLQYLEHPNTVIAADAFSEFAIAKYKDIVPLAPLMKPERIRSWLKNPETPADRVMRTGFFGLMLGLCGDDEDADFLKEKLLTSSENYQFGLDGMTSGYILLSGKEGFDILDRAILSNPESSQTDLFQVLQSLRFIWTYDRNRIPKEDLFLAMRSTLKRPEIADMVMQDLGRWRDWGAMEQIVALYGKEGFDNPHVKRKIIQYLITAKGSAKQSQGNGTSHVAKAIKHLERFEKTDPKIYKQAERYFFE